MRRIAARPCWRIVAGCLLLVSLAAGLPRAAMAADVDPDALTVTLEPVAAGFDAPVFVTGAGDGSGRLFVVERGGVIRVTTTAGAPPAVFIDLRAVVGTDDDKRGLLGLAFHPEFATNGSFFVAYTAKDGANTIARYRVLAEDPARGDPASGEVLLAIADDVPDHNLGMLAFGPDGLLYATSGDGGGTGDPGGNAQDLGSLLGKVLRLDVDVPSGYAVPPDNPFAGVPGARGEVWALGLRSPWRFAFDRATGDLWLADVGQSAWEEVNRQPAGIGGQNYGWPVLEGTHCYPAGSACDASGFTAPVAEYGHDEGCSVTGGYVYRGSASPALAGQYVFGDFCTGRIWSLRRQDGGWLRTEVLDTPRYPSSFGEDDAGELYLTDIVDGRVYRLRAEPRYPAPSLSGLYPASVLVGSDAFTLRVYGDGFTRDSRIQWGAAELATTFVSTTLLTAAIPASELTVEREVPVGVTNPAPGGGSAGGQTFRVTLTDVGDEAFARTWARTDDPVATGRAARTWMWGDTPRSATIGEEYAEAPNGIRDVQYWDKARMEITSPGNDPDSLWYVTNGLLVRELITGERQLGNFIFEQYAPATVNIAGDPDDPNGPTYATFAPLMHRAALAPGTPVIQRLTRDGRVQRDPALVRYGVVASERVRAEGLDHTVASVFWEFMNARGLVLEEGAYVEDALFENPFYATGFPLTEAYWTTVRVGGVEREVLVQAFERRVLTWTPDNPPGWQVEAGNVGQHYSVWRYGSSAVAAVSAVSAIGSRQ